MKTTICVLIKDEQDYLKEWIDYHLNIGIDEIYLFEDYTSTSHSMIADCYSNVYIYPLNIVSPERALYGCEKQDTLFKWFVEQYKTSIDWILFTDIDEFLILKQPLNKLLKDYDNETGLLLKWKFYGASGHVKKPTGTVFENYTRFATTPLDYVWSHKSFVNCKNYRGWKESIHGIFDAVYPIDNNGNHKAWLNHYFTKSWEDWKFKLIDRGDCAITNRNITQFFRLNPDMVSMKNEFLLEIAIENAKKLGFNNDIINNKDKKYFHFCWFGGNEFNDMNKKCIESWKHHLGNDYIVCLWNELSFGWKDTDFTRQAYHSRAWAFVSDYARLWCIYNFGGVYFDTDVELLKPIYDLPECFFGIEREYNSLATGLGFGANKENVVIGEILKKYESLQFSREHAIEMTIPSIVTDHFTDRGYDMDVDDIHEYMGFTIYPSDYFCPKSNTTHELTLTDDTISIHHYHGSWTY